MLTEVLSLGIDVNLSLTNSKIKSGLDQLSRSIETVSKKIRSLSDINPANFDKSLEGISTVIDGAAGASVNFQTKFAESSKGVVTSVNNIKTSVESLIKEIAKIKVPNVNLGKKQKGSKRKQRNKQQKKLDLASPKLLANVEALWKNFDSATVSAASFSIVLQNLPAQLSKIKIPQFSLGTKNFDTAGLQKRINKLSMRELKVKLSKASMKTTRNRLGNLKLRRMQIKFAKGTIQRARKILKSMSIPQLQLASQDSISKSLTKINQKMASASKVVITMSARFTIGFKEMRKAVGKTVGSLVKLQEVVALIRQGGQATKVRTMVKGVGTESKNVLNRIAKATPGASAGLDNVGKSAKQTGFRLLGLIAASSVVLGGIRALNDASKALAKSLFTAFKSGIAFEDELVVVARKARLLSESVAFAVNTNELLSESNLNSVSDFQKIGISAEQVQDRMQSLGLSFSEFSGRVRENANEIIELRKELLNINLTLPQTAVELGKIAAIGKTLGLGLKELPGFVKFVAKSLLATKFSAEESANAFGRLGGIIFDEKKLGLLNAADRAKEMEASFLRLGSAVISVSNNSKAFAKDITLIATRSAFSAKQVGLSEAALIGMSASLREAGLTSARAGTNLSKLLRKVFAEFPTFVNEAGLDLASMNEMLDKVQANGTGFEIVFNKILKGIRDTSESPRDFVIRMKQLIGGGERMKEVFSALTDKLQKTNKLTALAGEQFKISTDKALKGFTLLGREVVRAQNQASFVLKQFRSALGSIQKRIFQIIRPGIVPIIKQVNSVLGIFSKLDDKMQKALITVIATTAAVLFLTTAFLGLGVALFAAKQFEITFVNLLLVLKQAALGKFFLSMLTGFGILAVIALSVFDQWKKTGKGVEDAITEIGTVVNNVFNSMKEVATDFFDVILKGIDNISLNVLGLVKVIFNIGKTIAGVIGGVLQGIVGIFKAIGPSLFEFVGATIDFLSEIGRTTEILFGGVIDAIKFTFAGGVGIVSGIINDILSILTSAITLVKNIFTSLNSFLSPLMKGMSAGFSSLIFTLLLLFTGLVKVVVALLSVLKPVFFILGKLFLILGEIANSKIGIFLLKLTGVVLGLVIAIKSLVFLNTALPLLFAKVSENVDLLKAGYVTLASEQGILINVLAKLKFGVLNLKESFVKLGATSFKVGKGIISFFTGMPEMVSKARLAVNSFATAGLKLFGNKWRFFLLRMGVAWDLTVGLMTSIWTASLSFMAGAFAGFVNFVRANAGLIGLVLIAIAAVIFLMVRYWKDIKKFAVKAWNAVVSGIKSAWKWLKKVVPGLSAFVNGIKSLAGAVWSGLSILFDRIIGKSKKSLAELSKITAARAKNALSSLPQAMSEIIAKTQKNISAGINLDKSLSDAGKKKFRDQLTERANLLKKKLNDELLLLRQQQERLPNLKPKERSVVAGNILKRSTNLASIFIQLETTTDSLKDNFKQSSIFLQKFADTDLNKVIGSNRKTLDVTRKLNNELQDVLKTKLRFELPSIGRITIIPKIKNREKIIGFFGELKKLLKEVSDIGDTSFIGLTTEKSFKGLELLVKKEKILERIASIMKKIVKLTQLGGLKIDKIIKSDFTKKLRIDFEKASIRTLFLSEKTRTNTFRNMSIKFLLSGLSQSFDGVNKLKSVLPILSKLFTKFGISGKKQFDALNKSLGDFIKKSERFKTLPLKKQKTILGARSLLNDLIIPSERASKTIQKNSLSDFSDVSKQFKKELNNRLKLSMKSREDQLKTFKIMSLTGQAILENTRIPQDAIRGLNIEMKKLQDRFTDFNKQGIIFKNNAISGIIATDKVTKNILTGFKNLSKSEQSNFLFELINRLKEFEGTKKFQPLLNVVDKLNKSFRSGATGLNKFTSNRINTIIEAFRKLQKEIEDTGRSLKSSSKILKISFKDTFSILKVRSALKNRSVFTSTLESINSLIKSGVKVDGIIENIKEALKGTPQGKEFTAKIPDFNRLIIERLISKGKLENAQKRLNSVIFNAILGKFPVKEVDKALKGLQKRINDNKLVLRIEKITIGTKKFDSVSINKQFDLISTIQDNKLRNTARNIFSSKLSEAISNNVSEINTLIRSGNLSLATSKFMHLSEIFKSINKNGRFESVRKDIESIGTTISKIKVRKQFNEFLSKIDNLKKEGKTSLIINDIKNNIERFKSNKKFVSQLEDIRKNNINIIKEKNRILEIERKRAKIIEQNSKTIKAIRSVLKHSNPKEATSEGKNLFTFLQIKKNIDLLKSKGIPQRRIIGSGKDSLENIFRKLKTLAETEISGKTGIKDIHKKSISSVQKMLQNSFDIISKNTKLTVEKRKSILFESLKNFRNIINILHIFQDSTKEQRIKSKEFFKTISKKINDISKLSIINSNKTEESLKNKKQIMLSSIINQSKRKDNILTSRSQKLNNINRSLVDTQLERMRIINENNKRLVLSDSSRSLLTSDVIHQDRSSLHNRSDVSLSNESRFNPIGRSGVIKDTSFSHRIEIDTSKMEKMLRDNLRQNSSSVGRSGSITINIPVELDGRKIFEVVKEIEVEELFRTTGNIDKSKGFI